MFHPWIPSVELTFSPSDDAQPGQRCEAATQEGTDQGRQDLATGRQGKLNTGAPTRPKKKAGNSLELRFPRDFLVVDFETTQEIHRCMKSKKSEGENVLEHFSLSLELRT